jgi:membrane protein
VCFYTLRENNGGNMKINFKSIIDFIKAVFEKWVTDKAPKLAASLAFYTIFSLSPLLIIVISVAGILFGAEAARGELVTEIEGFIGREGAEVVQTALSNTADTQTGMISILISLITLMIGSTIVFIELQDSLDMIWKVKPKPGRGLIKGLVKDRLQSFALVLSTGFLLLVSLVISAGLNALSNYLQGRIDLPFDLMQIINLIFSLAVLFVLFGLIYKVLPDVHISWSDVWVGALVTALLFTLGKYLIGIYLGTSTLGSTYGAAGSLVILLLWVYYSSMILFLGAEFTQVYANKFGSGINPTSKFMKYSNETAMSESPDKE